MRSKLWALVGACMTVALLDCSNEDCRQVKYCRVYDVLGGCTADTCAFKGVELRAGQPDPSGVSLTSSAWITTTVHSDIAEIIVELGAQADRPAGLDQLVIDFNYGIATSILRVELSNARLDACVCDCQGAISVRWTCDAAAVGGAQLKLFIGPGAPYGGPIKVFYTQSACTSERTMCFLG